MLYAVNSALAHTLPSFLRLSFSFRYYSTHRYCVALFFCFRYFIVGVLIGKKETEEVAFLIFREINIKRCHCSCANFDMRINTLFYAVFIAELIKTEIDAY